MDRFVDFCYIDCHWLEIDDGAAMAAGPGSLLGGGFKAAHLHSSTWPGGGVYSCK